MQTQNQCHLDVDRGPDWIFLRLHLPTAGMLDAVPIAEPMWSAIDEHHMYRVVVDLEKVPLLHSYLIGQLVMLHKRVHAQGGVLRLCGLSEGNESVLRTCRLDHCLPCYANRGDAVMGHRPNKLR